MRDRLRYDFIDRFDLPNFKRLRAMSRDYSNAYLGYMGAETVVSHLVLPAGKMMSFATAKASLATPADSTL